LWLLRRVLPADQVSEIEGDLAEVYASRYPDGGSLGGWWFWRQTGGFAIRYLPERSAELLGLTGKRYWRPSRPNRNRKASAMEQFIQDLRQATRGLLRERGFSAMVILTLALGIGATTAVFSVVNGLLLKPLPIREAGRVMMVWENDRVSGTEREFASVPDYYDFLELNTVFEDMAMYAPRSLNFNSPGLEPQRLQAEQVSHSWDDLLGIRLVMGRGITAEEDQPGGQLVTMISEGLWTRLFATSPDILGTRITLNDQAHTIIGVVGHEVSLTIPTTDLWVPLQLGPTSSARSRHNVGQIARLKPGVTVAQAQEEMTALATQLEDMYPENAARGVFVEPITEVMRGPIRPALLVLFGAVLAVLLIACANVANLLLARGSRRATEVAIHAALGATPRRMFQRFLAESLVLIGASWVIGIGLALVGLRAILGLAPAALTSLGGTTPDVLVLSLTLVTSGAIAFGFGLLPAWQGRRLDLQANLKAGRRQGGSASVERMRFQRFLVVGQMAVAFVLLIGSALLINSFWRLSRVDPGFTTSNVLRVSLLLPESRYPRDFRVYPRWPEVHQFNERLLQALTAIPGVQDAALAVSHPLDGGWTNSFRIAGRESEASSQPEMPTRLVSADYFRTMGVPLAAGRGFEDRDHTDSPLVMLINQAAADRFFSGGDAIGARITFWGMEREVVGIVGNERFYGLAEDTPPAMYAATSQAPPAGEEVLLVRTAGDPRLVVDAVRRAIWEQDADLAIFNVATLDETLAESLATERFTTVLLLVFGGVALILALVGVYGVLAYLVARRRHEIGVRLAIGASSRVIVRMVLRQGMVLALVGMFLGVGGAVALSGSLRSLLFEISPLDPVTYVMAATGLVIAAGMACLVPALRASRVDPVEAIRAE